MTQTSPPLQPLPYHQEIVDLLKEQQPKLWEWFASGTSHDEQTQAVRLELLKSAYRLDPETSPGLYEPARLACSKLGLDVPVTFYQSQRVGDGLNAGIAFIPGEIHILLHGPVTDVLDEPELLAMIGHELAHYLLLTSWDKQFLVADQVLSALSNDVQVEPAHQESHRLFRLYSEIFCDRGAKVACEELHPVVSTLVKVETGLKTVSAESYLKQADEIFSHGESKTQGLTHPECFIRARAIKLWQENGEHAEPEIRRLIEGSPTLQELDLVAQRKVGQWTRTIIDHLLSHPWMRTETVLSHARLFFEDYAPPEQSPEDAIAQVQTPDENLQLYLCYVMLDFVTTDAELEDVPLAAAVLLAEQLKLTDRFEEIVRKELKLRKKQFDQVRKDAADIVRKAGQEVRAS